MEDKKKRYLLFWTGKEAGMFLLCKSLCLLKVVEKLGNLTSEMLRGLSQLDYVNCGTTEMKAILR